MGQPTNRVALFLFVLLIAGTALAIGTHRTTDAAADIAPAAGPPDRCDGIDPVSSFICRNAWMVFLRHATR